MKNVKYGFIPYIALGLVLSPFLEISYTCEGLDMFPEFFGSPFVFKQKSLGSSMTYYYSIWGLFLNVMVWSGFLTIVHWGVQVFTQRFNASEIIRKVYFVLVGLMLFIATLFIVAESVMLGPGFEKDLNYWYWDMDQEAEDWGVDCEG